MGIKCKCVCIFCMGFHLEYIHYLPPPKMPLFHCFFPSMQRNPNLPQAHRITKFQTTKMFLKSRLMRFLCQVRSSMAHFVRKMSIRVISQNINCINIVQGQFSADNMQQNVDLQSISIDSYNKVRVK